MATVPNFSQPAIFSEVSTPTAPDSGYLKVYGKAGALCSIANGGSEKTYAASSDLSSYLPLAGGTLVGDLKFTDATYDIGKSGATRPRDGFFSRDLSVGGTSYATSYYFQNQNLSIAVGGTYSMNFYAGGVHTLQLNTVGTGTTIAISSTGSIGFASSSLSSSGTTGDTLLFRDAAGILHQRNGTNAQTFRLAGTYTSSTAYELFNIKGKASANFEIGPENGSAGGTLRGLTIGGYSAGSSTITPWLTFTSTGAATFSGTVSATTASPGTNTTQVATTAFVTAAITSGTGVTAAKVLSYSLIGV